MLLMTVRVTSKRIKAESYTSRKGMMWVPALLFCSSFLAFFPFRSWIAVAQPCATVSSVNALSRIQLPTHCNSGCQFSSLNLLWNCLVMYLLYFQVRFFTYYFSWLQNSGFYLKLPRWQSLNITPPFGVSIFASLSPLWWRSETSGVERMVTFVFPHSPHGLCLFPGSNHGKFHSASVIFLYRNVLMRCICPCDKCHPGVRRLVGLSHLSHICQEDWGL